MIVRDETGEDMAAIRLVIETAFGRNDEADLVDHLRRDGDREIALVAEVAGAVAGYALFSRMTGPVRALGLGPVAVDPDHAGEGIGSALIREGLKRAAVEAWDCVFVLGDPAFYRQFGFHTELAAHFVSPYSGPYFMAVETNPDALCGKGGEIAYAPAFGALPD